MRQLLFITLFLQCLSANAADYMYWHGLLGNKVLFSTPDEACINVFGYYGYQFKRYEQRKQNPPSGACYFVNPDKPTGEEESWGVDSRPNPCNSSQEWSNQTGQCQVAQNKCEILKDTNLPAFRWSSPTDDPPQTVSINGCAATITRARCSYLASGKASCTGTATMTGKEMPASPKGTSETCEGSECMADAPKAEKENQECVYVSNSAGTASCTAFSSENNPGNSDCGTVNGEFKCIRNPKATSVTNKLESTKTEKSNTDGTLTTVKDNTLTTTKCVDSSCSTSTTKSKGTTTTNSNGQTVGQSSSCTGANCNTKGETNGTGDANKADDGKGDEEEGEEEGESPTVTPPEAPEKGNLDGEGDKWDQKIEESKTELKTALDEFKTSFNPIGDVQVGGGSGGLYCPPGTTVLGQRVDICLDKYSNQLSWLGSAIYALCAAIALLIVFT